jgi:hypothetical protein
MGEQFDHSPIAALAGVQDKGQPGFGLIIWLEELN